MRRAMSIAVAFVLGAAAWPEIAAYRAEWRLAEANALLAAALRGEGSVATVEAALADARVAMAALPGDARAPLAASIALLMLRRAGEAKALLERALASGERPELTLNLGRARGTLGDDAGAERAFLRTAWASPAAIATLPAPLRARVLEHVQVLEARLRDGRLDAPPPLD